MNGEILLLGYGPVGRALARELTAQGRTFRVAQRTRPADLPPGVTFTPCDVLDAASVQKAVAKAEQVAVAIGFPYRGKLWQQVWPRAMRHLLDACSNAQARMVFFDNLYMYGPQNPPLTEDMPLTEKGRKPAARAAISQMWQQDRRVQVAALRAPDFYGPGVLVSQLGATTLAAIARGKVPSFPFPADQPHDYAYVPDIGRAMATLLGADDAAFGQVWHMPCAPTMTTRDILAMAHKVACEARGEPEKPLRLHAMPPALLQLLAPFVPTLRELLEMRFQWDRPYQVDATKWRQQFWSDVTSFEDGLRETIRSYGT